MRNLPHHRFLWRSMLFRLLTTIFIVPALLFSFGSLLSLTAQARALSPHVSSPNGVIVNSAVRHDVSPPLHDMAQSFHASGVRRDQPLRLLPVAQGANAQPDPVVQSAAPRPNVTTTDGVNRSSVGDTSNTPANPCGCAPPDTNGAVGATQFVQGVNSAFTVYDKSSNLLMGPTAGNALWSGFGGPCQTNNDGDILAQYDKAAGRWVLSQFSVTGGPSFFQCVAVSTTSDATGTYSRYAFQEPNFNDYPKLGIWPDGYYFSFNMFSGNSFVGARACALDRSKMLAGAAATQVCFQQSSSVGSLLPSDLDGTIAPPSGEPDFYLNFGSNGNYSEPLGDPPLKGGESDKK